MNKTNITNYWKSEIDTLTAEWNGLPILPKDKEKAKKIIKTWTKEESLRRIHISQRVRTYKHLLKETEDMTGDEIIPYMVSEVKKAKEGMAKITKASEQLQEVCTFSTIWAEYQNILKDMKEKGIIN